MQKKSAGNVLEETRTDHFSDDRETRATTGSRHSVEYRHLDNKQMPSSRVRPGSSNENDYEYSHYNTEYFTNHYSPYDFHNYGY